MLMYLNKKVNDNINNPFKARTAGMSTNNFDFQSSNSHNNSFNNNNNNNFMPNQFTTTYAQSNFMQGIPNTYQTNNYMSSTVVPGNIEQQFRTSEMSRGAAEQMMSGSANSSGMFIMPETNFCNYKIRGNPSSSNSNNNNNNMQIQQGNDSGMGDKYGMNNTAGSTMSGGLLNHKYGMNNNNNIHNVGELSSNSIGGGRITDNNVYEEEYPRQMTHPSQQQSS
jgi:hypothetical protein